MYRYFLILVIVLVAFQAHGQTEKNFTYYNDTTYLLYLEERWEDLIFLAKESIRAGHDFYYMRMRLGIAYYESGQYIPAIRHFNKALDFDENSLLAIEYLYYCHINMARFMEAKKYYNYAHLKNHLFNSIYFEPGIKISDGSASTGDIRYAFLGLNHELGRHVNLFHGYQRLGADLETTIDMTGFGGGYSPYIYRYTIIQNEYYAALSVLVGKGFFITPAFHVQGLSTTGYRSSNRVFSGQLDKFVGRFKIYGAFAYSDINSLKQRQFTGGLVYYPFGNTKLHLLTDLTSHDQDDRQSLISRSEVGIKLFTRTWINGSLSYGDMVNYSEANSYLVYNQLDIMKYKWTLSINQYLGKHLFFINYTHEDKREFGTEIPFVHHDFILGINIAFY